MPATSATAATSWIKFKGFVTWFGGFILFFLFLCFKYSNTVFVSTLLQAVYLSQQGQIVKLIRRISMETSVGFFNRRLLGKMLDQVPH